MSKPAILFDLDGTLIDSAPDLHGAAVRMLDRDGRAAVTLDQVRSFIGNGVPKLVERVIAAAGLDMADHARLTAVFLDEYNAHATDLTQPYPGVIQALETLADAGFALGICTNKPEAPARQIVEAFGMTRFFGVVIGGDTLATRKPDPEGLRHGFTRLRTPPGLFVGDSEVDADTAVAADVAFALFTGGYRKSPVSAIPHHIAFDDFAGFPAMAERLLSDTARV